MKILHIVTYVSPDGAFGGPARVAINQAEALGKQGHEVIVTAAAGGFGRSLPNTFDNVPVKLHRGHKIIPHGGFAGLISPGMMVWLIKAMANADVVHIHLARDLVTLPAAFLAKILKKPMVVQPHGMIVDSEKALAKPLDAMMTVPVLRSAGRVLYLTENEKEHLRNLMGNIPSLEIMPNGVNVPSERAVEQEHGPAEKPEVTYLARLHPVKRPIFIVNAARALHSKWPLVRFALIGPDEGEGPKIQKAIKKYSLEDQVTWEGPVAPNKSKKRLIESSIFALPSERESFGMSVAEAMALGVPVVVTDGCGLAPIIRKENAGIVCNKSQESFNKALERLLEQPELRIQMGANGRRAVKQFYSMSKVSGQLEEMYEIAIRRVEKKL